MTTQGTPPKVGRPMGKLHQEDVRAKIQAGQLIKVLENHALNDSDLSPTRIKAIEILLRKKLPDLQSIEHTGEGGGPVVTRIESVIIDNAPG